MRSASILYCYLEPEPGTDRDQLVKQMQRFIAESWVPSLDAPDRIYENRKRVRRMHRQLSDVEVVAGRWNGPAASVAHHAHLTGRSTTLNDTLVSILEYDVSRDREMAHRWIRPERAAVVHLAPLPAQKLLVTSAGRSHDQEEAPYGEGIDAALDEHDPEAATRFRAQQKL